MLAGRIKKLKSSTKKVQSRGHIFPSRLGRLAGVCSSASLLLLARRLTSHPIVDSLVFAAAINWTLTSCSFRELAQPTLRARIGRHHHNIKPAMYGQRQPAYAPTPYTYNPNASLATTISLNEVCDPVVLRRALLIFVHLGSEACWYQYGEGPV
jgi:hypothetical protein